MTHVHRTQRGLPAGITDHSPPRGRTRIAALVLASALCMIVLSPTVTQAAIARVPDVPAARDDRPGLPPGPSPRPAPRPPRPELDQTGFDADRHGFAFVNAWTKDLSAKLPLVGRVDFGSFDFGLCGGMVYAAADSHFARASTPTTATEPKPGSALRSYIFRRQIDSLTAKRADALRRFLRWQMLPLNDKRAFGVRVLKGLRNRSRDQYKDQIRPRLGRGAVVPLGMVKVHGVKQPWLNHQVLATGFRDLGGNEGVIAVYDPNHPVSTENPDGITYLNMRTRRQSFDPQGREPTGDTFRAIFRTHYSRKAPPWRPNVRDHRK